MSNFYDELVGGAARRVTAKELENEALVQAPGVADLVDLTDFSVLDLFALRSRIDKQLPARQLADLDLQAEAVAQFIQTQALQAKVLATETVPMNQVAQVVSTCAAMLLNLEKMQKSVFDSERIKLLEHILVSTINEIDNEELSKTFFRAYAAQLRGVKHGNYD